MCVCLCVCVCVCVCVCECLCLCVCCVCVCFVCVYVCARVLRKKPGKKSLILDRKELHTDIIPNMRFGCVEAKRLVVKVLRSGIKWQ